MFSAVPANTWSKEAITDCCCRETARLFSLWERLGSFAPNPLADSVWAVQTAQITEHGQIPRDDFAGKRPWPILKTAGFTDFTNRLGGGPCRTNKAGDPRPKVEECHLRDWLMPTQAIWKAARSAFDWSETAAECFLRSGSKWFYLFADAEAGLKLLQQDDWTIFWRFPMLRGLGAKASPRRLIYLAYLSLRLSRDEQARKQLRPGESDIDDWYHEHMRPHYRDWVARLREDV